MSEVLDRLHNELRRKVRSAETDLTRERRSPGLPLRIETAERHLTEAREDLAEFETLASPVTQEWWENPGHLPTDPIQTAWDRRTRVQVTPTMGPPGYVGLVIGDEEPPISTFATMSPDQAEILARRLLGAARVARERKPS